MVVMAWLTLKTNPPGIRSTGYDYKTVPGGQC